MHTYASVFTPVHVCECNVFIQREKSPTELKVILFSWKLDEKLVSTFLSARSIWEITVLGQEMNTNLPD